MKKIIVSVLVCVTMLATIAIVHAQETIKQMSRIEKMKHFLNSSSVEIMDSYTEGNISVYKVHDISNDRYYKLALDSNDTVGLYKSIKYGVVSKIDDSLQMIMNDMNDDDKINVIVELTFDYTGMSKELNVQESQYYERKGISTLSKEESDELEILKHEYVKDMMINYNKLEKDYEIIAISEYSPFMFLNLTKGEIEELKNNNKVFRIGLIKVETMQEYESSTNSSNSVGINNNSIYVTRTNSVKSAGMTGSSIKIGQIESGVPITSNSYLAGKSITKKPDCSYTTVHATEVAGIMIGSNGVAPSASLYSACLFKTSSESSNNIVSNFVSGINWLISKNVDIINMSAKTAVNVYGYDTTSRWLDAMIYMNDVVFVGAAGNDSNANTISSPNTAFNAITIGSIDYTGTDYAQAAIDAYKSSFSSYTTEATSSTQKIVNKPEIVVPGEGINYTGVYSGGAQGTSFSAPLVSGTTALLMQSSTAAKNDFTLVKAALFATARPIDGYYNNFTTSDSNWSKVYYHYNEKVGLGILDTKAAYDLLRWGQYRSSTVAVGTSNSYTYNNTLGNGMDVRVAISWSKPNTATNINNISYGSDQIADLDLQIIGPNGEQIVKSISTYDNVEWIRFTTSNGYGQYKFKVINWNAAGNTIPTKFSMAWW